MLNASVNSSCNHPPPPGQCGAFVRLLVPTAGHLQLRVHPGAGHLSISGYYPRAFVAHRERTAATSFLCCMPKWTTIKYIKQILYYIIVECWFSSVNQCLSGCLTKNHAERFRLKIRFPLYFYHEPPLS